MWFFDSQKFSGRSWYYGNTVVAGRTGALVDIREVAVDKGAFP